MFDKVLNRRAFLSLLTARTVYAINWYSVASIFSLMAVDFGQGVSGLGSLTSSFYLGIGLFQIPGGMIAVKIGPRLTAALGTIISSVAVLVSAAAVQFEVIMLARFFVGLGMALVFAPAVTLITQYFRKGSEGLGIGLYISAFQMGGIVGLFGWVVLATAIGWRLSLVTSGAAGLLTGIILLVFVPRDGDARFRVGKRELSAVLLDRRLWLLGVVAVGLSVGSTLVSSFMVYYLIKNLAISPAVAGGVGALVFVIPIFSSPFGGRVYDRQRNFKLVVALAGSISAFATMVAGFGGIYGPVLASILTGFLSGLGFTMVISAARESNLVEPHYRTLSVAWVNSISLTGSFIPPILFSLLADALGYTTAWVGGGVLSLLLLLPIVLSRSLGYAGPR